LANRLVPLSTVYNERFWRSKQMLDTLNDVITKI